MSKQDADASEVDEAEEVLCVPIPAHDEAAVVVEPGEQALDLPAAAIPAERTPVLGLACPAREVRRNELDSALLEKALVQGVAVVGAIANHAVDHIGHECLVKSLFDQCDLVR